MSSSPISKGTILLGLTALTKRLHRDVPIDWKRTKLVTLKMSAEKEGMTASTKTTSIIQLATKLSDLCQDRHTMSAEDIVRRSFKYDEGVSNMAIVVAGLIGGYFAKTSPWRPRPDTGEELDGSDESLTEAWERAAINKAKARKAMKRKSKYTEEQEECLRLLLQEDILGSKQSRKNIKLGVIRKKREGCLPLKDFTEQRIRDKLFIMAKS